MNRILLATQSVPLLAIPFMFWIELDLWIDNLVGSFTRLQILALAIVFTHLFSIGLGVTTFLLLPPQNFTMDWLSIAGSLFTTLCAGPFLFYSWDRFVLDQCCYGA